MVTLRSHQYHKLDLNQLQEIAGNLTKNVKIGDVICLKGDLGVGKTQFAKFFIQALTTKEIGVCSPTFNLVQLYDSAVGQIWHFDLYRLTHIDEVYEIGLEQALADGISLIEWPEIVESLLPRPRLEVALSFNAINENFRDMNIGEVK